MKGTNENATHKRNRLSDEVANQQSHKAEDEDNPPRSSQTEDETEFFDQLRTQKKPNQKELRPKTPADVQKQMLHAMEKFRKH